MKKKIIYAFKNVNMIPALDELNSMGVSVELVARRKLNKCIQRMTPGARFWSPILGDLGIDNLWIGRQS